MPESSESFVDVERICVPDDDSVSETGIISLREPPAGDVVLQQLEPNLGGSLSNRYHHDDTLGYPASRVVNFSSIEPVAGLSLPDVGPNRSASDQFHAPAGGSTLGGTRNQNVIHNNYYTSQTRHESSTPLALFTAETSRIRHYESAADTYARILLTKRIGYPLWTPEPSNILPEYEEEGVRIGDVGIIDSDGQFDFLFNVCLPNDHPINRRSPPSMIPFTFEMSDTRQRDDIFESHTVIESESICENLIYSQVEHGLGPSQCLVQYQFNCSTPEGAVLVLPNGASRKNLRFRNDIQEYAYQHVLTWYENVYRTLGLEVDAGPLYLITGYDKCDNWCVASYSNIPAEICVSLSFNPTTASSGKVLYSSRSSGAINRRTFVPRDRGSTSQCVFIRGFKMTLCKTLIERILEGPVKISDIIPPNTGNHGRGEFGTSSRGSAFSRLFSWPTGGNGTSNSAGQLQYNHGAIKVESFPSLPKLYHPSDVINSYLLDACPGVQIAMTHDDDWCNVIEEKDITFPADPELIRRIIEKYCPRQEAGCVTLIPKEDTMIIEKPTPVIDVHSDTVQLLDKFHSLPGSCDAGEQRQHGLDIQAMTSLSSTDKSQQDQFSEAETLQIQVMEAQQKALGNKHPKPSTTIANPAVTYEPRRQFFESERLQKQVMETHQKMLGDEHPDTLTSMTNLALIYKSQGQFFEAERLQIQVMETRQRMLGDKHPDTLTSMTNLALIYKSQGQFFKAEMLQKQVMKTCQEMLGDEHPDTLASMANLVSIHKQQGRSSVAEWLQIQVTDTRHRTLGHDHPNTLASMAELASIYKQQGRFLEADDLAVKVLITRQNVLGTNHPDTLASMSSLIPIDQQGPSKEAERLRLPVVEAKVLDSDHPDTLANVSPHPSTTWPE